MFKTIMMTFKFKWQNRRWSWHVVYARRISQGSIKTPFKWDYWILMSFFPYLLGYMCTNNYSNRERYDKVIAKIKWCSFFASQCALLGKNTDPQYRQTVYRGILQTDYRHF